MTANQNYYIPFYVPNSITANRIAVVVLAPVTGTVRLGIYNSSTTTLNPTTRLLDAGTVSTASSGLRAITISQALSPGLYFLACVASAAPGLQQIPNSLQPINNPISGGYPYGHVNCYLDAGQSGLLPSTWVIGNGVFAQAPVVLIGVA